MSTSPRSTWLWLALLVSLYVPFLGGGFLTDDFAHLNRLSNTAGLGVITAPDAFRFYRPLTQASLKADTILFGDNAAGFRAVNLLLHAAVLAASFVVARLVLVRPAAAAIATIAFALTPKAHPIAVLWISGRAELLMALFSFLAVAAWIVWSRNGRRLWLVATAAAFCAAVLSKETAFPLPLVLLATPAASRPWRSRMAAALMLLGIGAALFAWRTYVGALAPLSADSHYELSTPLWRWGRNLRNYVTRMSPAPLALLAAGIVAMLVSRVDRRPFRMWLTEWAVPITVFSLAWSVVFLAAVLPIVARSELYLYVPVFGLCVFAASLIESVLRGSERHRIVLATAWLCAIGLAGFQMSRSLALHRDAEFSAKLVAALESHRDELTLVKGPIVFVPADAQTKRFFQDAIGGYAPHLLRQVLEREYPAVALDVTDGPRGQNSIRIEYSQDAISLRFLR